MMTEVTNRKQKEPGLSILFLPVYYFVWGGESPGQFTWVDVDQPGGVGDVILPLLSGHLSLCEVRVTHFQDTSTHLFDQSVFTLTACWRGQYL